MNILLLSATLLLFIFTSSQAQIIKFEGLKRTRPAYLLRVSNYSEPFSTDTANIERTIQILRNTQLFTEITFRKSITHLDTVVIITCSEVRSLLPVAELGATRGNQWFRIGVKDENGAGRGIKTVAFYQFNDKHSFYLKQNLPFLFNSWGLSYVLRKWSFLEPFKLPKGSQFYVYDNNNAEVSFTYPFDINRHELELGVGVIREKFSHTMPGRYMESPSLITQEKISVKAIHNIRRMDFRLFYQNGWANTLNVFGTYEVNLKQPFLSIFNDFRFFRMLPFKTNLAVRNRLGISTNSSVFLAPFVLDSYYNIRGVGNRVDRGTASIVLNTELRKTIWENKAWGFQAVGFCDSGTWRKPGGMLNDVSKKENILLFAGLGSRLIYKKAYDVIFRLDYGWKIQGVGRGFVFGIGQYF